MKISFIQPSRNNLKYLKWSYDSIRKNQGDHEVEICVADDASTDGTWDWCLQKMDEDKHFKAIKNDINIFAIHTNLDNVIGGVNGRIADQLKLVNRRILNPSNSLLVKLVVLISGI